MALERGKKGEISSDVYNDAYKELAGLAKKVPRNDSIELREIVDKSHPVLLSILNEFPHSTVHDLGGQPILNIIGIENGRSKDRK
jgi:hypothetical protein